MMDKRMLLSSLQYEFIDNRKEIFNRHIIFFCLLCSFYNFNDKNVKNVESMFTYAPVTTPTTTINDYFPPINY